MRKLDGDQKYILYYMKEGLLLLYKYKQVFGCWKLLL
jgi:hypothetical protein